MLFQRLSNGTKISDSKFVTCYFKTFLGEDSYEIKSPRKSSLFAEAGAQL